MDEFEKWFKSQEERELTPFEWMQEAWQESAKQAVAGERARIVVELELISKTHANWAIKDLAAYLVKRLK